MTMKILLLEDDKILCESLQEFLELEGYIVDVVHRGSEVFDLTYDEVYDLYILDVNVPDIDGFDVLTELKQSGDTTPAIYITALTDINSISKGFGIGVDDYIKKPFDPEELVIRIKNKYQKESKYLRVNDLVYNPNTKILQKNGQDVGLGDIQQRIFHLLMTEQNTIVDSYELIRLLEQPTANALRVNIVKLKKKLGIEIKNIRGKGYMIESV